jgi:ABC-type nitrate/sulfonate/bicarbonate transport system permease component
MTPASKPARRGLIATVASLPDWLLIAVTLLAFLSLWEVVGRYSNPLFLAPISQIAGEFVDAVRDPRGRLLQAILETIAILAPGFLIAALLGVGIGVLMGRREIIYHLLDPYVLIFYNTPRVVLIPILMLWIGTGSLMKMTVVILAALFPIIMNTMIGVRDISAQLTEPARSFGASERQLLYKVVLPGALPYITTGIRLGLGRALTTVVVAEIFVSVSGLGRMLHVAGSTYQMAKMFVPAAILALIGIAIEAILGRVERTFSRRYGL